MYVYEALILVLSAGVLGIIIGAITAWTFTLQRTLFLQTPLNFNVPFAPIAVVALVSALLSAAWPAVQLTRTSIVKLLKSVD